MSSAHTLWSPSLVLSGQTLSARIVAPVLPGRPTPEYAGAGWIYRETNTSLGSQLNWEGASWRYPERASSTSLDSQMN